MINFGCKPKNGLKSIDRESIGEVLVSDDYAHFYRKKQPKATFKGSCHHHSTAQGIEVPAISGEVAIVEDQSDRVFSKGDMVTATYNAPPFEGGKAYPIVKLNETTAELDVGGMTVTIGQRFLAKAKKVTAAQLAKENTELRKLLTRWMANAPSEYMMHGRKITMYVDPQLLEDTKAVLLKGMRQAAIKATAADLNIDSGTDQFELARSLHRVVRAMHDGHCPSCGHLGPSPAFEYYESSDSERLMSHVCPNCGFTVTADEAEEALAMFLPYMQKNHLNFVKWQASRK